MICQLVIDSQVQGFLLLVPAVGKDPGWFETVVISGSITGNKEEVNP